jgi:DUF1365 family protein
VSLLLSLNALENYSLDLGRGWLFGYGGRWARLVGLRAAPYLTENGGTIRQRLEKVLLDRGFASEDLEDAWMMTMPSLLGFEGINPLTVYFCYRPGGQFFLVILEVRLFDATYCVFDAQTCDRFTTRLGRAMFITWN